MKIFETRLESIRLDQQHLIFVTGVKGYFHKKGISPVLFCLSKRSEFADAKEKPVIAYTTDTDAYYYFGCYKNAILSIVPEVQKKNLQSVGFCNNKYKRKIHNNYIFEKITN